jgi:molybdenum cofactor guanylyltransferase
MKHGAIILCGGGSTRMGMPKLALPFGPETMLERIVRLVGDVCAGIVVVAAPAQDLPQLPRGVILARDKREGRGPLEGLAAGLAALPAEVEAAYATSCDVPLLVPTFVRRMFELLGEHDAAVPVSGGYHHPLAAVYRPSVLTVVDELLAAERMRPAFLFDAVDTRRVSEAELREVDPELHTLRNLNRPEDYLAALAEAGFSAPETIAARLRDGG